MFGKRARKAVVVAIGLTAALSLTACNEEDIDGAGSPAASSPADQGSGSSGSSGSGSSGSGSSGSGSSGSGSSAGQGSTDAKTGICRTDSLEITAVDNTTDKTQGVVTVQFKNAGDACVVNGFPGVDLKTSDDDSFSVERNGDAPGRDVIKQGESAAFNIYFPVNNTGGSGVRLTQLVVTPPNETKHVTLGWPAGSLPVSDGSDTSKMEISPVRKVG